MRIQHNIMAMNAYRNYNTNTSALSKNLEKLSSGYKINRAGDDAAGLAISEKMRAQITGLDAATKNVKDGISLVKTAEGAMQEIQDMLNRMDYLATQSANGTYDNEVDRANLNKEMDALKTEIDRIADSANFNGTKLLDGSLDSDAADRAQAAVDKAQAALDAANATGVVGKDTPLSASDVLNLLAAADPNNDAANVNSATILETESGTVATPGFKVSMDGVSHVLQSTTSTTNELTLNINGSDFKISEKEIVDEFNTLKAGDTVTSEQLAQVFAKKIMGGNANVSVGTGGDAKKWTVVADGKNINFTYDTTQAGNGPITDKVNLHYNVKLTGVASGTPVDAVKSSFESTVASFNGGTLTAEQIGVTVAYKKADGTTANKVINYTITADDVAATMTADQLSAKLAEVMNADADLGGLFNATYDATSHKFTLTAKEAGTGKGAVTGITVSTTGTSKYELAAGTGTTTDGANAYTPGTNGYVNAGTEVVVTASPSKPDQLASTILDLTGKLADGSKITLGKGTSGEMTYVIAKGPNSAYNDTDVSGGKIKVVKVADNATEADIASALSEAAKDNTIFSVSHIGTDGKIGLKQLSAVKGSTDMTTREKIGGYIGVSTVSAAESEALKAEKVAAAQAELTKAQAAQAALKDGKELMLQIGDTSDTFNQMGVKIGDMHVSAMGTGKAIVDGKEVEITKTIKDIDILKPETAHDAINVIKNAINYVSGIRGDLGAVQNRLEHTSNNLSVMKENIQDAESTIRDTDVAEEMMAYTKNNILIQSAQAMLAQANAVPQGVLQLLG